MLEVGVRVPVHARDITMASFCKFFDSKSFSFSIILGLRTLQIFVNCGLETSSLLGCGTEGAMASSSRRASEAEVRYWGFSHVFTWTDNAYSSPPSILL